MKIRMIFLGLLTVLITAACQPVEVEIEESVIPDPILPTIEISDNEFSPTITPQFVSLWEVEVVVKELEIPWSLVFTSPQRMLISERTGRVREVLDGQLNPEALYDFAEVASLEEAGLMGMALDPNYTETNYVYACYASGMANGLENKVVRLVDLGDRLEMDGVVMDGILSAKYHAGCRLQFGPDGKLYITTGDALRRQQAQNLENLAGKIL